MEFQLKDPACQSLFVAFKQKQNVCVLREDFQGASKAKASASEVRRLGRQLTALRSLNKATVDSKHILNAGNINLDDADAVRKIREQKNQTLQRDVMREREEQALLEKLDFIREEAIASSHAIGVVIGLDSFMSSKRQAKEHALEEKTAIDQAGKKEMDMLNALLTSTTSANVPVEAYLKCHDGLTEMMKTWLLNST